MNIKEMADRYQLKVLIGLSTKPIRKCYSLHVCRVCGGDIKLGQRYFDGGYGRRAHTTCAMNTIDRLTANLEDSKR